MMNFCQMLVEKMSATKTNPYAQFLGDIAVSATITITNHHDGQCRDMNDGVKLNLLVLKGA
jgi:hypothetical protein